MNLYVWEGVLEDWTAGLVVVLAETEDQAWTLLQQKDETAWWILRGRDGDPQDHPRVNPRVVEAPEAFVMWGGA